MLRPPPPITPPHLADFSSLGSPPEFETMVLSLRLHTPMFGGSATARQTDPEHPIRAASIRGHLRFWWRATVSAHTTSAAELFRAEESLWGSAQVAGQVALMVEVTDAGHNWNIWKKDRNGKDVPVLPYFLWPFQQDGVNAFYGRENVSFHLKVRFPLAKRNEVRAALRAWILFGGVGARTRRGCGALTVEGDDSREWLPHPQRLDKSWFNLNREPSASFDHPHIDGASLFVGRSASPTSCQQELASFWKSFRAQMKDDNKRLRSDRTGGSIELDKPFLGLPIVFQNPQGLRGPKAPFEGKVENAVAGRTRFASPVILKPACFSDGMVRPIVLILQGPRPQKIHIVGENRFFKGIVSLQPPRNLSHPLDAVCEAALVERFQEVRL